MRFNLRTYISITITMLLAALASGCSDEASMQGGTPVGFGVYTAGTTAADGTRGTINQPSDIFSKGIGVFAFHQRAKSNGVAVPYNHNMGDPDFMYNQKVTSLDNGNTWTYAPLKYWPNNENDMLSFFAYAPYDHSTSWEEDMALSCSLDGTRFRKTFKIYPEATDQKDYLWANPVLNRKKQAVGDKVLFQFSHVCARLGFRVGVDTVGGATAQPTTWKDPDTDVKVTKIEMKRVYRSLDLLSIYDTSAASPAFTSTWTGSGSMVATLTATDDDATTEMQNNLISATTWAASTWPGGTPGYRQLNLDRAYMFLAPQKAADQDIEFTLYYDLITRENGTLKTIIHKTYTHKLSDLTTSLPDGFEQGKAYTITYLIRIDHVAPVAMRCEWDSDSDIYLNPID